MMKCGQCKKDRPNEEFVNKRGNPRKHCSVCATEIAEWYKRNRKIVIAKVAVYRQANHDKILEKDRRYKETHRGQFAEALRAFNQANPGANAKRHREYREQNPDKVKQTLAAYRERHREELNERSRIWREENRDKANGSSRNWYWNNREEALKGHREWREKNPGAAEESCRKWRQAHPDQVRVQDHARRARILGAEGTHSGDEIQWLFEQQGGRCEACRKSLIIRGRKRYHIDHMEPLSRGGSNDISNLQLLCPNCNTRKQAIPYEEWCSRLGRLPFLVSKVS